MATMMSKIRKKILDFVLCSGLPYKFKRNSGTTKKTILSIKFLIFIIMILDQNTTLAFSLQGIANNF